MTRMFTRPAARPAATLFGTVRCDGEFSATKPIAAMMRLMPKTAKRLISTADCTLVAAGFSDGGLRKVRVSGLSRLYAGTAKSFERKKPPEVRKSSSGESAFEMPNLFARAAHRLNRGSHMLNRKPILVAVLSFLVTAVAFADWTRVGP